MTNESERVAFEKWAKNRRLFPLDREPTEPAIYRDCGTSNAWTGWQARAQLIAEQEKAEAVPDGMQKISRLIERLTDIQNRFGDTCVWAEKLCWGASALHAHAEHQAAPSTDQVEQEKAEAVAVVDAGEEGLFVEIVLGPNGSELKVGDKLYLHTDPIEGWKASRGDSSYVIFSPSGDYANVFDDEPGGDSELLRQLAQDLISRNPSSTGQVAAQGDSETLTKVIAEMRAREAVGRAKYGTDVDRTDLTHSQWRQHLREELTDAILYLKAEERTAQGGEVANAPA